MNQPPSILTAENVKKFYDGNESQATAFLREFCNIEGYLFSDEAFRQAAKVVISVQQNTAPIPSPDVKNIIARLSKGDDKKKIELMKGIINSEYEAMKDGLRTR